MGGIGIGGDGTPIDILISLFNSMYATNDNLLKQLIWNRIFEVMQSINRTFRRPICLLLALAHRKNRSNQNCYLAKVPKEILLHILKYVGPVNLTHSLFLYLLKYGKPHVSTSNINEFIIRRNNLYGDNRTSFLADVLSKFPIINDMSKMLTHAKFVPSEHMEYNFIMALDKWTEEEKRKLGSKKSRCEKI